MTMILKRAAAAIALLATGLLPLQAAADEVADFYKGKTVNIVVGHEVATGFDIYARVLARHLGRYIPGNPAIVVFRADGFLLIRNADRSIHRLLVSDGDMLATDWVIVREH